jgi:ABC-type uncharacterized transport system auxiliary subunit
MFIPLAKMPARALPYVAAWALAAILAGCGGGNDDTPNHPVPPTPPCGCHA